MRQVLSVADFVTIVKLLTREIDKLEHWVCEKFGTSKENGFLKTPAPITDPRVQQYLKSNAEYQSLLHLKKSLENLNIEVETPDVKIESKGE